MNQKVPDSKNIGLADRARIERLLLLPILDALRPKHKICPEKYDIPNYELVGIIIADIKRLKNMVQNQRKAILKLRSKTEKLAQTTLLDLLKTTVREIEEEP